MTEPNIQAEPETKPKAKSEPVNEFEFRGHQETYYTGHLHPETEGVLHAKPGEVVDFGTSSPPDDGWWYNTVSGEQHPSPPQPSPSVEDDASASAQEDDAEEPED